MATQQNVMEEQHGSAPYAARILSRASCCIRNHARRRWVSSCYNVINSAIKVCSIYPVQGVFTSADLLMIAKMWLCNISLNAFRCGAFRMQYKSIREALAAGGSREDMCSPCILQGTTIKATFVNTIVVYKKNHFTCMLRTDHLDAQGVML